MAMLLAANNLHKSFHKPQGDVVVLAGCVFSIAEREAVAIIGPSGAGKSTLLNVIGGLDRPEKGTISYREQLIDLNDRKMMVQWRSRTIGFIFQFHFLLPDFSAFENLLIPVRMTGILNDNHRERAAKLLDAMGLSNRADHLPGELSGGEQQRVAVARAFMNQPRIVLADEPFGNLDREKGEQLGDLLFDLKDRDGTSLVLVTHDMRLASRADRVLRLVKGRLQEVDLEGGMS